ncbi:uncharacterized protein N7473_012180 [Penicillium subrubescens]|uniref:uncharacterized protein n=1 Tax=Penicillium subrubescens TaxID=1316194 RepID=UPI002545A8DD|nr:uncharacterized protein N7473_012180 [Penicillium subrubescens]KAJ5881127.1 hypothetical protein N7473_012180 [Penicillium subrubescens]
MFQLKKSSNAKFIKVGELKTPSLAFRTDDVNEHVKKSFRCFDLQSRDSSPPTIRGHAMEWDDLST